METDPWTPGLLWEVKGTQHDAKMNDNETKMNQK